MCNSSFPIVSFINAHKGVLHACLLPLSPKRNVLSKTDLLHLALRMCKSQGSYLKKKKKKKACLRPHYIQKWVVLKSGVETTSLVTKWKDKRRWTTVFWRSMKALKDPGEIFLVFLHYVRHKIFFFPIIDKVLYKRFENDESLRYYDYYYLWLVLSPCMFSSVKPLRRDFHASSWVLFFTIYCSTAHRVTCHVLV